MSWKMKTNAGPFQKDMVVTNDDIKTCGASVDDWKEIDAIEESKEKRSEGVNPTAIPGNPQDIKPATTATVVPGPK